MSTITVSIKCSTGDKFTLEVEPGISVQDFKKLCAEKSSIPAEQQRLIFSGHVLKDPQTLESYSIKDGVVIHLVRGASVGSNQQSTSTPQPSQQSQSQIPPQSTNPPAPNPFAAFNPLFGGIDQNNGLFGLGNDPNNPNANPFGDLAGLMGGNQGLQQMQAQLLQNPAAMRDLMNSPMMQNMINGVMQNPDLMRNMLLGNPQMREVIERNPEIGHMLNDPALLRQTMQMASNPELMREMMRNSDRAMSNIENHPEGFNLLRRMYTNVQEPMMNAATQPGAGAGAGGAGNPFAALFNPTPAAAGTNTPPAAPSPNPNTAPLPNPWAAPAGGAGVGGGLGNAGLANLFGLGGGMGGGGTGAGAGLGGLDPGLFGDLGLGGLAGAGGGDPANMLGGLGNLLQNPGIQQAMQQMFQNPEMLQQVIDSNPVLRQATEANPELAAQLRDPAMMNQLTNPQNLQALMQLQQALQQLQGSGIIPPNPMGAGGRGNMDILNLLGGGAGGGGLGGLGGFGGLGGAAAGGGATGQPQVSAEERFRVQLDQLNDMGFTDRAQNIIALTATNGNVNAAIERLLR